MSNCHVFIQINIMTTLLCPDQREEMPLYASFRLKNFTHLGINQTLHLFHLKSLPSFSVRVFLHSL